MKGASSSWIKALVTTVVVVGSLVDRRCTAFTAGFPLSDKKFIPFHLTRSFSRKRAERKGPEDASAVVRRVATSSSSSSSAEPLTPTEELLSLPPGRSTRKFARLFHDDTLRLLNPKTMARYQLTRKRTFGSVFKTNVFCTPTVFVVDDDTIQQLGIQELQHKRNFQAFFPPHHTRLFGPGSVLVTSGLAHDRIRQLVAASLSPTIINAAYQTIVQDSVHTFVRDLASSDVSTSGMTDEADGPCPAMVPRVRAFFIQLMLQVVLGSDGVVPPQLACDIELWSRGLLAPPLTMIPWSRASKALRARNRISDQLQDIIQRSEYRPNGLLAKLLEARVVVDSATTTPDGGDNNNLASSSSEWRLSTEEVIDNVLTLLFAGSDTTASATMSVWKVLAEHPTVKHDLKNDATDERIDAFVRLVMQAHPPAPFSMRRLTEEVRVGEYRIPANWLVVYGLAGALLSRAEPDHWIVPGDSTQSLDGPTPSSSSRAASWLPFGTGPRQCPGRFLASLELRCMARCLAQLEWELEPGQNLSQRYTPGLFPVDGFKVKVTKLVS